MRDIQDHFLCVYEEFMNTNRVCAYCCRMEGYIPSNHVVKAENGLERFE